MQAFCLVKCQKKSVPISSAPLNRQIIQILFYAKAFAPNIIKHTKIPIKYFFIRNLLFFILYQSKPKNFPKIS